MKPTQQEIIELAREAGVLSCGHKTYTKACADAERLVHLALERFGAGGGEPVAWLTKTGSVWKTKQDETDAPLYTHPSPTDLRAEYLRGLEDAAEWVEKQHTWITSAAASAGIRALKGKQ